MRLKEIRKQVSLLCGERCYLDLISKQQSSSVAWKAFLQNMRCSKNYIRLQKFSQYLHLAVRLASLHKFLIIFPRRK